ncbi:two-component system sensor histidine kinase [Arcobacter venerupis]|uniref:histidine kinase n=1 Tax=Arcobacter venerupis TaxID=1054033 RepID=A0AAE7B6H7_9BACT|nr:ATP-binding protein [Arcobacter venerupis]QKF66243.1 two-component system sensor histidine kinase [Arcobacter venerupis]RWS50972.1 two-component sensor histidine kinase [Arcobacter venerupis]
MTTNLSIKKKLLIYSFFIQVIVLVIFSFSIYKALEISTLDRYQATLKVILLDIVDDLKEKNNIVDNELDEEKEYNFEPLYIRILDNKDNTKIIQTSNFPNDLHSDNTYLDSLKDGVINFQEQDIYLVSRIKINFNASLKIIVEIATTKDMLWTTLENLLYILFFIVPIVLIFAVIGGNFLIYKSFSPIEKVLEELKSITAIDLTARLKSSNNQDEINQLINEINNLLERLESSFERISQFSSDASHELKTPLTIIKGEMEIALRKDRSLEEYKQTLNTSLEEVIVIEQTINDLLFLAKNEKDLISNDMQTLTYFDEIIDESINEVKNFAKLHQIKIKFNLIDTIEIRGYSNLLKIAIKNILKNAIQFSHENSEILVKSYKKDELFNISIQDFGIGIEKKEQNKIFEKFYRTDKSRNKNSGGTGLGMSIVKKIIDIHKADVTIKSKENFGTTIILSFKNK